MIFFFLEKVSMDGLAWKYRDMGGLCMHKKY